MPYLPRHIAPQLYAWLEQFPVVALLGARQVGKSTFLEHQLDGWRKVDLESAAMHELVAADPELFLRDNPDRVWFDEAQRCPALFSALRVTIDRDRRPGRYVLSGSATPRLVEGISQSLAGRAGLLQLWPLSTAEAHERPPSHFLRTLLASIEPSAFLGQLNAEPTLHEPQLLDAWLCGGFPEPWLLTDGARRARWFDAYLQLISERDLGELHRDLRPVAVLRLLRMLAARHGQVVNTAALARDFGCSHATMGRFLDILEGTGLWWRLQPYHPNIGKRLVRRPKGFLADSGMLHALSAIADLEALRTSPLLGASWEGFVLGELMRALRRLDLSPTPHFWATHQGAEVDLVLERGDRLWPIEIKHAARIGGHQLKGLRSFLGSFGDRVAFAVVVHRGEQVARLDERIVGVPATWVGGMS